MNIVAKLNGKLKSDLWKELKIENMQITLNNISIVDLIYQVIKNSIF